MVQRLHIDFGEQPRLCGELYLPKNVSLPIPGAILCHGLGSGRDTVRSSALNLAKRGMAAMIFDFRGHGRSQGVFDGNGYQDVLAAWGNGSSTMMALLKIELLS